MRRYHDPSEAFFLSCNFAGCAYKTVIKWELKNHVETHNPNREPNFICSLCHRSFHEERLLRHHIAVKHTGEECYSCELCKFRSNNANALKKHMKQSHASEPANNCETMRIRRKYKCGFCSHSAANTFMLVLHVRAHTGEKPFPCSICSFRTSQKSYLKKHVEKIHGPPGQKHFHVQKKHCSDEDATHVQKSPLSVDTNEGMSKFCLETYKNLAA